MGISPFTLKKIIIITRSFVSFVQANKRIRREKHEDITAKRRSATYKVFLYISICQKIVSLKKHKFSFFRSHSSLCASRSSFALDLLRIRSIVYGSSLRSAPSISSFLFAVIFLVFVLPRCVFSFFFMDYLTDSRSFVACVFLPLRMRRRLLVFR